MTVYIKDPNATLDYAQDFSAWLAAAETIASHTVIVPTGITKASDSHTTDRVTAWLSGGTVGENYTVTYRVTTNQGRTDDRSDMIRVRER